MRNNHKDDISNSSDANSDDDMKPIEMNEDTTTKHGSESLNSDSDSENNSCDDDEGLSRNSGDECSGIKGSESENLDPSNKKGRQEKSTSLKSTFNLEDLTSDDELYMFQCPASYNLKELCGKSLGSVNATQGVLNETEGYQLEFLESEKKLVTLAVPGKSKSGKLVNLPLRGHITIKKVVGLPVQYRMPEDSYKNSDIVFPDDIKLRHPLLGVDWEDHIKIANGAIKKRKHSNTNKTPDSPDFARESSRDETPVKKKKKKSSM